MKQIKSKDSFARNVLTLMTGTTIAQALTIAISPILTRVYSPEDFGLYGLFMAIVSIVSTFISGRYELAIILPEEDKDAINLLALGLLITITLSLVLFLCLLLLQQNIVMWSGKEQLAYILYLAPLAIFFTGFFNLLRYYNNRKKKYGDISNATVIKSVVLAFFQLVLGFLKAGTWGLIIGQVVSSMMANLRLLKNIMSDKKVISFVSKSSMIVQAKKYKDFPLYNAPAAVADVFALEMSSMAIPKIFGLVTAGYFFFAKKMVTLPSSIISNAISDVFFQTMSEHKNKQEICLPFLLKTLKKLSIIAFIISLLIAVLSPYAFPIVFGDKWQISGEIAQYLAAIFFITFVVSPLSSVFSISGYIKTGAIWKYFYLITSSSLFFFCFILDVKFFDFLLYFMVHEYMLYLAYFYLIWSTTKKMDKEIESKCAV